MTNYRPTLAISEDAADPDLVTEAQMRQALGDNGTLDAGDVTALIQSATSIVEGYCHAKLKQRTYVETWYDPPQSRDFRLRRTPAALISEILDKDGALIPATDYELVDQEVARVRFYETAALCQADRYKLSITYVAGYDPIPADLQQAALSVGQALFNTAGINPLAESERIDDYAITYAGAGMGGAGAIARLNIPQMYRQVLDRYRILNLW